jgi:asparagine synthase (glutamine-hydrolysing)
VPGLTISDQFIAQDLLKVLPGYSSEVLSTDDGFHILMSGYSAYPYQTFEHDGVRFIIEGRIYDLSEGEVRTSLISISGSQTISDELAQWVAERDGDFLLCIQKPTGELVLANDRFGRLPLYFHSSSGRMIFTRETGVLLDMIKPKVNKVRAAAYLVFGFVPGDQLLYEGIQKLPPHSVVHVSAGERPLIRSYFDNKDLVNAVSKSNPDELKELLKTALSNRIRRCGSSALALSGGLDSRILAALLTELRVELPMLTYSRSANDAEPDVLSAKKVAQQLHREQDHKVLNLAGVDSSDVEELWKVKRGQNFLAMAYCLPFLRSFGQEGLTQITGDGGDKTLESIEPLNSIRSEEELIDALIRKHQIISPSIAAQLVGVSVKAITEHVRNSLPSEEGFTQKERYRIFIIRERAMNWLFEGEDRNRYYSWTVTPYYAPDFFYRALHVNNDDKKYGKLFTALLTRLPGHTEQILNPNWMLAPMDTTAVKRLMNRQRLKMKIPQAILSLIEKKQLKSWDEFLKQNGLQHQWGNERLPKWLNGKDPSLIPFRRDIELWTLFTLLKMIEDSNQ